MKNLLGYPLFRHHLSTFRDISADRANRQYMTYSSLPGIDFDAASEEYANAKGFRKPNSNDALFESESGLFFMVEFKNGRLDETKIPSLHYKVYDTILMYMDITGVSVSDLRENMIYILVYNEFKNPEDEPGKKAESAREYIRKSLKNDPRSFIASHVSGKAGMCMTRFGLKKFEGLYLKASLTMTKKEFDRFFIRRYEGEYTEEKIEELYEAAGETYRPVSGRRKKDDSPENRYVSSGRKTGYAAKAERGMREGFTARAERGMREGFTAKAERREEEGLTAKAERTAGEGFTAKAERTAGEGFTAKAERTAGEGFTAKTEHRTGERITAKTDNRTRASYPANAERRHDSGSRPAAGREMMQNNGDHMNGKSGKTAEMQENGSGGKAFVPDGGYVIRDKDGFWRFVKTDRKK